MNRLHGGKYLNSLYLSRLSLTAEPLNVTPARAGVLIFHHALAPEALDPDLRFAMVTMGTPFLSNRS